MDAYETRLAALRLAIEAHGGSGPAGTTFAEDIARAALVYASFLQGAFPLVAGAAKPVPLVDKGAEYYAKAYAAKQAAEEAASTADNGVKGFPMPDHEFDRILHPRKAS